MERALSPSALGFAAVVASPPTAPVGPTRVEDAWTDYLDHVASSGQGPPDRVTVPQLVPARRPGTTISPFGPFPAPAVPSISSSPQSVLQGDTNGLLFEELGDWQTFSPPVPFLAQKDAELEACKELAWLEYAKWKIFRDLITPLKQQLDLIDPGKSVSTGRGCWTKDAVENVREELEKYEKELNALNEEIQRLYSGLPRRAGSASGQETREEWARAFEIFEKRLGRLRRTLKEAERVLRIQWDAINVFLTGLEQNPATASVAQGLRFHRDAELPSREESKGSTFPPRGVEHCRRILEAIGALRELRLYIRELLSDDEDQSGEKLVLAPDIRAKLEDIRRHKSQLINEGWTVIKMVKEVRERPIPQDARGRRMHTLSVNFAFDALEETCDRLIAQAEGNRKDVTAIASSLKSNAPKPK